MLKLQPDGTNKEDKVVWFDTLSFDYRKNAELKKNKGRGSSLFIKTGFLKFTSCLQDTTAPHQI